jgi:hypothetical protein
LGILYLVNKILFYMANCRWSAEVTLIVFVDGNAFNTEQSPVDKPVVA